MRPRQVLLKIGPSDKVVNEKISEVVQEYIVSVREVLDLKAENGAQLVEAREVVGLLNMVPDSDTAHNIYNYALNEMGGHADANGYLKLLHLYEYGSFSIDVNLTPNLNYKFYYDDSRASSLFRHKGHNEGINSNAYESLQILVPDIVPKAGPDTEGRWLSTQSVKYS